MSKTHQNGVRRDPEVMVRPSRRIIGDPDKVRILSEVDQVRSNGGKVNETLRQPGIDHTRLTFRPAGRRLTDARGSVVKKILA